MTFKINKAIIIKCDNQSAIAVIKNPENHTDTYMLEVFMNLKGLILSIVLQMK